MKWEILMGYPSIGAGASFGAHLRWGETFGWGTLILSVGAGIKGAAGLVGAITTDVINPWLILIASTVTGAVAVGTVAYSRIQRSRLEGATLEAIYHANNAAIAAGRPVPWPAFLPKGAIVTTMTIVDMSKPAPTPESQP